MKIIRTAIVMAIIAGTSACSSTGDASIKKTTIAEVDQNIHDGVTTSSQVRQIYGEPGQKTYEDGYEVWIYSFTSGRGWSFNSAGRSRTWHAWRKIK
nr:hypothetical protein [Komagataeibacter kakiaceti]